ncbi:MAG: phenylalanine--tRNA ligase subunit beta [Chloroflexi bacterium]|nr:phenylalanine--tRNA ligase subunit beta [Chloroflexota bacterium]
MPVMRVSLRWLRDYVDLPPSVEDLAHRLTLSGTEVGGIRTVGVTWDEHVRVAQITRIEPHPNADRLRLATVTLGGDQEKTVVCGAPNIQEGQKVPLAQVGAVLKDASTGETMTLKAAKIRGVVSEGMLCSPRELGLSEEHEGILILDPSAPVGQPLRSYLGDTILDLDVTPNRPDCLSMLGVAREVGALSRTPVREPDLSYPETAEPADRYVAVAIDDPELCPRYTASIIEGVRIGPSPRWMQERLEAAGMRPINNVVDITNYVMLEYGQPLHAFDYDRIRDRRIVVSRARPGETLTTLDGVARTLDPDMLLICDGAGPVALAGVMGGLESEVSAATTTVLLESASFDHRSIRRTSTRLGLRSEASLRFDKGLSPEIPDEAARRAVQLMLQLAGGRAAQGMVDVYPGRTPRPTVRVVQERMHRILGIDYTREQVTETLTALGFSMEPVDGARDHGYVYQVTPPPWRIDVAIPEDVAEELARIIGYEDIPAQPIAGQVPPLRRDPLRELKDAVKDLLAGLGLQEIITYSLVSLASLRKLEPLPAAEITPLRVANPMSAEQEHLRTTLRGSLLTALAANQRNAAGLRLFEVGRVYLPRDGGLPEERETLVAALAGARAPHTWLTQPDPVDYYDLKGVVEAMFDRLGVAPAFESGADANLHPGRTARILVEGTLVGHLGELHPEVAERFDLELRPVEVLEVDLAALLPFVGRLRRYAPLGRFPGVVEDLALIVDLDTPADAVRRGILRNPLVTDAVLFDVYTGPPVPAGKKSLAYSVTYQSPVRTLTSTEVAAARQDILAYLSRELGAVPRA